MGMGEVREGTAEVEAKVEGVTMSKVRENYGNMILTSMFNVGC